MIDLSGALAGNQECRGWIPDANQSNAYAGARLFAIPSAHAEIVVRLAAALRSFQAAISAVAFQPVSIGGTAGVEELESQTGQLLSFQPPGKVVFDAQVAFNMLDRFGTASRHNMSQSLQILRSEIRGCLAPEIPMPAVQLLHAPVFYGAMVAACATLKNAADLGRVKDMCVAAGLHITSEEAAPSNLSTAGESMLQLAPPLADTAVSGAWWFWAAGDNLRRPAANAVKLGEILLA